MTEDVKQTTTAEPNVEVVEVTQTVEPSVSELSPVEQQAKMQGWMTKDEWVAAGNAAEDHRPAREYVERGELYKSIHSTKRELKQTQAALTALQKHREYMFEKGYEKAKKELREEKRAAIRSADMDHLADVESRIEELEENHQKEKQELVQATQVAAQPQTSPAFQIFADRNPWYVTDAAMRDEADAMGFIYLNKGLPAEGVFAHVEREMKRKFPEKFGIKKAAPNAVAAVDKTNKKSPTAEAFELTPEERQIMKTFVDMGVMTEKEYIAELKKAGR